jgi:hypothetical protein
MGIVGMVCAFLAAGVAVDGARQAANPAPIPSDRYRKGGAYRQRRERRDIGHTEPDLQRVLSADQKLGQV